MKMARWVCFSGVLVVHFRILSYSSCLTHRCKPIAKRRKELDEADYKCTRQGREWRVSRESYIIGRGHQDQPYMNKMEI
jgi:hypothetical protein